MKKFAAYLAPVALALALACGSPTASAPPTPPPSASTAIPAPAARLNAQAADTPTAVVASPTPATPAPAPTAPVGPIVVPTLPVETERRNPTSSFALPPTPITDPSILLEIAIESARLEIEELGAQAMGFLETLTADHSPRESATEQELEAAKFLAGEFESLGYETSIVPFTVERIEAETGVLIGEQSATTTYRTLPLSLSGQGSVTGAVIYVDLAYAADIPEEGLEGKVALIRRGIIPFEEKVTRVAEAGAIAAIIFNGTDGMFRGSLATQASIPSVSMMKEDGEALVDLLDQGEMAATVAVEHRVMESRNVIAEMKGTVDDGRSVVVGGHYDTVADVPGANDNGSGAATTMTVARAVAGNPYPFTVRFMLFGSEEEGLLGSFDYVRGLSEAERTNIIAMINYDALATGDEIRVLGDTELALTVMSTGDALEYPIPRQYTLGNSSSDHAVFLEAGIPALFFLAEDFSRIHTTEDKLEFVQPKLMGASAFFGIALLESLVDG